MPNTSDLLILCSMCISAAMGSDRAQLQAARGSEPGEGPGFTGSDVVIINRLVRAAGWGLAARAAEGGCIMRGPKPDLSICLQPVGDSQDGLSALS